jgi:hypothetical protein
VLPAGPGDMLGPAKGVPLEAGTAIAVGRGAARRQIGRFMFGVGVGDGAGVLGVGLNFGGGGAVGSGSGGTRGSGNPGSAAALMTSVRFQFGPYGEVLAGAAEGVTVIGAILSSRFSVTWPMTLSPSCAPNEIAVTSTAMPSRSTIVMKRLEGSSTGAYQLAQVGASACGTTSRAAARA